MGEGVAERRRLAAKGRQREDPGAPVTREDALWGGDVGGGSRRVAARARHRRPVAGGGRKMSPGALTKRSGGRLRWQPWWSVRVRGGIDALVVDLLVCGDTHASVVEKLCGGAR